MTLSEKILYYRKSAGLSQEELAARVGVSRQAVSKWETGESTPELNKVVLLARAFQITTDQLLSPEAPSSSAPPPSSHAPSSKYQAIPFFGRMVRRWGWLAGVYLFLQGAGLALVGGIDGDGGSVLQWTVLPHRLRLSHHSHGDYAPGRPGDDRRSGAGGAAVAGAEEEPLRGNASKKPDDFPGFFVFWKKSAPVP